MQIATGHEIETTTGWSHTLLVSFTCEEIAEAIAGGDGRQDYADRAGLGNLWELSPEANRLAHRIGAIGEWIGANVFKLPFDSTVGVLDAVDLKLIEVRTRRIKPGQPAPPLSIEREHKLRLPLVLLRLDMDALTAEVVGWLCGWQAIEREDKVWSDKFKCYFVPPPYHSIVSLQQWLACGHRPHWAPEQY